MAVASIPTSLSAAASRLAASTVCGRHCGVLLRSTRYSMTTPVGCNIVGSGEPGMTAISHPASFNGAVRIRANHSLSGIDGEAITVPICFSVPDSLAVKSCCSDCFNRRGASRASRVAIFDCCTELIPSSTVNSAKLQSVSATIPHNTNRSATLRTSSGPCSQTMPKPMAMVASASPSNKFQRIADEICSLLASVLNIAVHIAPLLLVFGVFLWATFELIRAVVQQHKRRR